MIDPKAVTKALMVAKLVANGIGLGKPDALDRRPMYAKGGEVDDQFLPHSHPQREQNLAKFMEGAHPSVLNEDGTPKVFYHGTNKIFSNFDTNAGVHGGLFFTSNPDVASEVYGWRAESHVMPVHVNLKNPLKWNEYFKKTRKNIDKETNYGQDAPVNYFDKNDKKILKFAKENGHDGIYWPADLDSKLPHDLVVAFHPHQIKSAVGNRGTYDLKETDITKSTGGDVEGKFLPHGHPEREQNLAKFMEGAHPAVLNEDGTPKVFYHGTSTKDFSKFSHDEVPYRGGILAFASENPKFASSYAKNGNDYPENARVYPVHLKVENPFDYRKHAHLADDFYSDTGGISDPYELQRILGWNHKSKSLSADQFKSRVKKGHWDVLESPEFVHWLRNRGHDAIITRESGATNIAVFHPHQIKSAIGNRGTYDPNEKDIDKAEGGEVDNQFLPHGHPQREQNLARFMEGAHPSVLNEDGTPRKLFHATASEFSSFNPAKAEHGTLAHSHIGAGWFTDDPHQANYFGRETPWDEHAKIIMPIHVSMKNPYILEDKDGKTGLQHLSDQFIKSSNITDKTHPKDIEILQRAFASRLKAFGHDGILIKNTTSDDFGGDNHRKNYYLPFDANQIKSATGNRGTYSPSNDDITKAGGGEVDDMFLPHGHPQRQENLANFMRDAHRSVLNEDGSPRVFYHGTKRDFSEFKPGYDDSLLFVTTNPKFASKWPVGTGGLREPSPESKEEMQRLRAVQKHIESIVPRPKDDSDEESSRYLNHIREEFKRHSGFRSPYDYEEHAGTRVMPVHVSSKNPFNPETDWQKIEPFLRTIPKLQKVVDDGYHKRGNWLIYEDKDVINQLKKMGHDAVWLSEDTNGPAETLAVFNGNQIKSATGNRGTYDISDKNITKAEGGDVEFEEPELPQRPLTQQGLYSGAAQAARNLPQDVGSPQQMIAMIKRTKGVRDDEIKYSGVEQAFAGKPRVTKEELAQHFEKSLPTIQERHRQKYQQYSTEGGENYREKLLSLAPEEQSRSGIFQSNHWSEPNVLLHMRMTDRPEPRFTKIPAPPKPDRKVTVSVSNWGRGEPEDKELPAWSSGVPGLVIHKAVEGGRDAGFTITHEPSKFAVVRGAKSFWAAHKVANELASHLDWTQPREAISEFYGNSDNREANERRRELFSSAQNDKTFAEPNEDQLKRFKKRSSTVQDGFKKHLLLDELQSDWGQKGRDSGFVPYAYDKELSALDNERNETTNRLIELGRNSLGRNFTDEEQREIDELNRRRERIFDRIDQLTQNKPKGLIPEGPWVTSTERWTDLGLKRALYEAAKGGHDTLAWAPAIVQAERYPGLSRVADSVAYHPENKSFNAYRLGRLVHSSNNVEASQLRDLIGKDNASQLLQSPQNNLGFHFTKIKDAPVGEQIAGMRKYYEGIVPKRLIALAQEHDPEAKIITLQSKDKNINGYPALPISKKMRESILKRGFPAFRTGGEVHSMQPLKDTTKALMIAKSYARGGRTKDNDQPSRKLYEETSNPKRVLFRGESSTAKGIVVPRHMWEGSQDGTTPGLNEINKLRAQVYGSEHRPPLSVAQIGMLHRAALKEHFQKPLEQQLRDENEALQRLRAAGHIGRTANTLDESEKLDTARYEHGDDGRSFEPYGAKGISGRALYSSGTGENEKIHILNSCLGQTDACGGGLDKDKIADTSRGICFANNAERQYPNAAVRRACHTQAKFDPAMSKDWILAHTGSLRQAMESADKRNNRVLFRPNVVDESDTSSATAIKLLNKQRRDVNPDAPMSIINAYSKVGGGHDPANGVYQTHSNVGPKVKLGGINIDNIRRDAKRIRETITGLDTAGKDTVNEDGEVTPPQNSYLVTGVKRYSPLDKEMQQHFKYAKYWGVGRPASQLTDAEVAEGPEGHFDGNGNPTTPDQAHYGHKTLGGMRFDYQNQHILPPRMIQVGVVAKGKNAGKPRLIPTDSRFLDDNYMPENRYKSKNGKVVGGLLVTTATTSTAPWKRLGSFTHHVDQEDIEHAKNNNGEYQIDAPEKQLAWADNKYQSPKGSVKGVLQYAHGGFVDGDEDSSEYESDSMDFPERNFAAHVHNAHVKDREHESHHHSTNDVHGLIDQAMNLISQATTGAMLPASVYSPVQRR